MPTVVFVNHMDQVQTVPAPAGGSLAKLCNTTNSPVPFHCRQAKCGTCRLIVLEGTDELFPPEERERDLLKTFGLSPGEHRLACQAQMRPGLGILRVRPLQKRSSLRYSLWVPVIVNIESKQMRVQTSNSNVPDISIIGTTDIKVGNIMQVKFQLPSETRPCDLIGRFIRVDPLDESAPNEYSRRYKTVIEFFEHNETLKALFEPFVEG